MNEKIGRWQFISTSRIAVAGLTLGVSGFAFGSQKKSAGDALNLGIIGTGDLETFDNVNMVYEYSDGVKTIFTSITTNADYGVSLQYKMEEICSNLIKKHS